MKTAFRNFAATGITAAFLIANAALAADTPLGLPPVPVPADNEITPAKVELGEKLFLDTRFSSTAR